MAVRIPGKSFVPVAPNVAPSRPAPGIFGALVLVAFPSLYLARGPRYCVARTDPSLEPDWVRHAELLTPRQRSAKTPTKLQIQETPLPEIPVLSKEAEMADAGLFIGYGIPVRGRERQAVKVFGEALEYFARLQQQGEIESFETVFLNPHGGDLNGFTLLRGDPDKLSSIRTSDEFMRLSIRADLITEGFGVIGAVLGEQVGTLMGVYTEQVEDLT